MLKQSFIMKKGVRVAAIACVLAGVGVMIPFGQMYVQQKQALARPVMVVQPPLPVTPDVVSGKPVRIELPTLSKSLAIIDGTYNSATAEWTASDADAVFMTLTNNPNNKQGDTLIYGHATPAIFGPILTLRLGAEALIYTDNGYIFTYTYAATQTVSPDNTEVLNYEGAPRLTLQTCTGLYSQNRTFLHFEYTGHRKM